MISSSAKLVTPNASRYLQTLCKHLGNKVPATFDTHNGRVELSSGVAELTADDAALHVSVTGEDEAGLENAQSVIERHLLRFAFREEPEAMTWNIQ